MQINLDFPEQPPYFAPINTLYFCQVGRKRPAFFVRKMRQTPLERDLTALLAPPVQALGFELLWLELKGGVLSVYCENPVTGRITLDECGTISRSLSPLLEETDPIPGAYTLEVGSAGIDRPLFTEADYDRYRGMEVRIELDEAVDDVTGQRRFKGAIVGSRDGIVRIDCEDSGMIDLPLSRIIKGRLVLTDELIKATKPKKEVTV